MISEVYTVYGATDIYQGLNYEEAVKSNAVRKDFLHRYCQLLEPESRKLSYCYECGKCPNVL
jgi:hypothetical protein